ncbi:uncharacterized protein LOC131633411 [Vicia villosa]|uniref:uncharacterized protein LOC131633411 n=1 Tax=Vicia villosa TaxID=3911 RepID=UPI00273A8D7F|nr:uncharacterized protein LOC131633411 [Vicia villosa]
MGVGLAFDVVCSRMEVVWEREDGTYMGGVAAVSARAHMWGSASGHLRISRQSLLILKRLLFPLVLHVGIPSDSASQIPANHHLCTWMTMWLGRGMFMGLPM